MGGWGIITLILGVIVTHFEANNLPHHLLFLVPSLAFHLCHYLILFRSSPIYLHSINLTFISPLMHNPIQACYQRWLASSKLRIMRPVGFLWFNMHMDMLPNLFSQSAQNQLLSFFVGLSLCFHFLSCHHCHVCCYHQYA